jgi:formate transporter
MLVRTGHNLISGDVMTSSQDARLQPAASPDAFTPAETARRLETAGIARAGMPLRSLLLLGLMGGLYIGFGGALATLVLTDGTLGYGPGRLAAGVAFSLGLLMLVVAGGELFTGNNLMVLAFAGRKISAHALLRNWLLVYAANAAGAILLALAIYASGILDGNGVKATAAKIAQAKAQLDPISALFRAILCNMLVCLAVWLGASARSVEGKAIAIVFPISAFVALGFEHCIANFYLLPIGMLSGAQVSVLDVIANLSVVTLGNTLGGIAVAGAYYLVYLDDARQEQALTYVASAEATSTTKWRVGGMAGWRALAPDKEPAEKTPAERPKAKVEPRRTLAAITVPASAPNAAQLPASAQPKPAQPAPLLPTPPAAPTPVPPPSIVTRPAIFASRRQAAQHRTA